MNKEGKREETTIRVPASCKKQHAIRTSSFNRFAMWDPMNPPPPPMQTLMTPSAPASSGWAFLNSAVMFVMFLMDNGSCKAS
jgi:hypothetical protein